MEPSKDKINKDKSKIIIFDRKENPEKIEDTEVTTEIKYLGITINNKKNCFKKQKDDMMVKAKSMGNWL